MLLDRKLKHGIYFWCLKHLLLVPEAPTFGGVSGMKLEVCQLMTTGGLEPPALAKVLLCLLLLLILQYAITIFDGKLGDGIQITG